MKNVSAKETEIMMVIKMDSAVDDWLINYPNYAVLVSGGIQSQR